MILNERDIRMELVVEAARRMMTAVRTAPKGKGMDIIETAILTGDDIGRLSAEMLRYAEETGLKFVLRDADNMSKAGAVLLIGTDSKVHGLNCAHCGFDTCTQKPDVIPCAINTLDVGIAIGSACSVAADLRVDTRVMFSAGKAAQRLQLLGNCRCVFAIPISISSKNPFFDRTPKVPIE